MPRARPSSLPLDATRGQVGALLRALSQYAIRVNASPPSRAGAPASASTHLLGPGCVEIACSCLTVLRALVTSNPRAALELCEGGTIKSLLDALRAPHLHGGAHDARLLLHSVDLLFAVSEDGSGATWPLVVRSVATCGGVCTLLEHLASAPPTLLPLLLATLADWMRDPALRADFRSWRAPAGLLLRDDDDVATFGAVDGADSLRLVLRSWQHAETHPHATSLVRAPTAGRTRPMALALLDPLPPPKPPPSWRRAPADRESGIDETVKAQLLHAAPLHARVGALVQVLRFSGGIDGVSIPPLPPAEEALRVAAESNADVQMVRAWVGLSHEVASEGWQPVSADSVRIKEKRHAGGSRIDGVWAAQDEIFSADIAAEANKETVDYAKLVTSRDANPMKLPTGPPPSTSSGALERRRRGVASKNAMLARCKTPWTPDPAILAEAKAAQRALHGASRLAAREAAWMDEQTDESDVAATKLQAAHRGRTARVSYEEKRKEARKPPPLLLAPRAISPGPRRSPTILAFEDAYQPVAVSKAKPRPQTAHK